jgi:modification methylase
MAKNAHLDLIHHGDCIELLRDAIPENSVDLIFADPPYNLQLQGDLWRPNMTQVDPVDDDWDQFENFAEYDAFTRDWLTAARRVMKKDATIWVSGTYHNIFRVGAIMQDLGFWILNTVSWFKPNAMPNFNGTRLKNDVEFVIWAQYSDSSVKTFHYQMMKRFNDFSDGKQLGSVWKIPACGGQERLRDANGDKLHSTQKPEELLRRIILASSNPGDVVLDPFSGSGTTAAVSKLYRRRWIGIEREREYVQAARDRVAGIVPLETDDPIITEARYSRRTRIAFKLLLKQGYVQAGQTLYFDKPEHEGKILANGHIRANGFEGSIHKVGALLKETPFCNGWTHWRYENPETGKKEPIDALRRAYRQSTQ